jgi:hypothetical protein
VQWGRVRVHKYETDDEEESGRGGGDAERGRSEKDKDRLDGVDRETRGRDRNREWREDGDGIWGRREERGRRR